MMIVKAMLIWSLWTFVAQAPSPTPDLVDRAQSFAEETGDAGTKGMQWAMFTAIGALATALMYQEGQRAKRDALDREQRAKDIAAVREHYEKELARVEAQRARESELLQQQVKQALVHHDQFVEAQRQERIATNEERGKVRDKLSEMIRENAQVLFSVTTTIGELKEVIKERVPVTPKQT